MSKYTRRWSGMLVGAFCVCGNLGFAEGLGTFYRGHTLAGDVPGYDAALADFDGDGACDIFIANAGENALYLNAGTATFVKTEQAWGTADSRGVAAGDVNADGYTDLVVANYASVNEVWMNNGHGLFTRRSEPGFTNLFYSQAVKLADLDADGDLDLFVAKSAPEFGLRSRVYLNDGAGTFTEIAQTGMALLHSQDVLLQDMNGDGARDALLANNGNNSFLKNNGFASFSSYATETYLDDSRHLAGGDLNGDGYPDFIAANAWPGPCRVYINKADGSGTTIPAQEFGAVDATGVATGDINSDGKLDVVLASWGSHAMAMTNSGNGVDFGTSGQILSTNNNQQVLMADLNGDLSLDLFFVNYNAPHEIWYNVLNTLVITSTNGIQVKDDDASSVQNGTWFVNVPYNRAVTNHFVLRNMGSALLEITGVTTGGPCAADFRVLGMPPSLVAFGSAPFEIVYTPSVITSCVAGVSLLYSGGTEPFVINLAGSSVKADQQIDFPNPGTQTWTNHTLLVATADSGLPVSYRRISGPAVLQSSNELVYTDVGYVTVAADQAGDAHFNKAVSVTNTFLVSRALVDITLYGLNQYYNGSPCVVTAATIPMVSGTILTYSGDDYVSQTNPPILAGSYSVLAILNGSEWYGEASDTLVISPAPQTITSFTPTSGVQCATNVLTLSATASSGLSVTNFEVVSGAGVLSSGNILRFTNSGAVRVRTMQPGTRNWLATPWVTNEYTVEKAVAQIILTQTQQVYNGSARAVAFTTVPASVSNAVTVRYDGATNVPVNAGTYLVTALLYEPLWMGGATTQLNVAQADPGLTWSAPLAQVTTNVVPLNASSSSTGLISYAVLSGPGVLVSNTLTFSGSGTASVRVDQMATLNYTAAVITQQFVVAKATGTITPNQALTVKMYDGLPSVIPYTTAPVDSMDVVWVCNGSTNLPSSAGIYSATGTLNNALYQGSTAAAFQITQAVQTISFALPATTTATSTLALSATASSALAVTFRVESGPGALTGGTNLSFVGEGAVVVRADQGGNQNWCAAPFVLQTVQVSKASATLTISNTSQVYNASARLVTVSTVPDGLTTVTTYDGLTWAPTNAGTYSVTSSISDAIYAATNTATLTITPAPQLITFTNSGIVDAVAGTSLTATASSGLPVSYMIQSFVPSNAQNRVWLTNGNQLAFSVTSLVSEVVVVAMQGGNANWQVADDATNVFLVFKEHSRVVLSDLSAVYDLLPHAATWSCTNASVTNVVIYYDGSARTETNPPTESGNYPVWALIAQADYVGGGVGEMQIARATQAVSFVSCPTTALTTNVVTLSATATSGLTPEYSVGFGPGVLNSNILTFTNSGAVQVIATQPGNSNYLSASTARIITVSKAGAPLSFDATTLTQSYAAVGLSVTVDTVPPGLTVLYTYRGSTSLPVYVGSYVVTGRVADAMYQGSITGMLTIIKGVSTVTLHGVTGQVYNGSAHNVSATTDPVISGDVVITYDGSNAAPTQVGTYVVSGVISDTQYAGSTISTMLIAQATQQISNAVPTNGAFIGVGTVVTCSAECTSGLTVQYTNLNAEAPITWLSATQFHAYATGVVVIAFTQAGDVNWIAAPTVVHTVEVETVSAEFHVALSGDDHNDGLSWTLPKRTIQAAMDAAAPDSMVWVSNGVYETGGRVVEGQALTNRVVVPSGVMLVSVNGAAATTIRGQAGTGVDAPLGGDAVRCVYLHEDTLMQGFTLEEGGTLADNQPIPDALGGGVFASSEAYINLCLLQHNHASFGGAMAGTNLYIVFDSLMTENTALHTAGAAWQAALIACTVSSNTASSAGGIGGLDTNQYAVAISSIVFGNTPDDANEFTVALASCFGSTNGLMDADSCITNAPNFVDPSATNYALQANSPCIENGMLFIELNTNDLAGNPRIVFDYPDMGAYEYMGVPAVPANVAFSEVQPWQVNLSWTNGGNVPVTNYAVTVTNDSAIVFQGNLASNITQLALTNLTPNKTYYASVQAQNEYGASATSTATTHTPKADQAITFTQSGAVNAYDGLNLSATADSGLTVSFSISEFTPSNAQNRCWITNGTQVVFSVTNLDSGLKVVAMQAGNTQYNPAPSVTNLFQVTPAPANVGLSNLTATYDGTPHAASWSCTNASVTNVVLYYGSGSDTNPPVNAGSYDVNARIQQPNIAGSGWSTLAVARATQQINSFPLPATANTTNRIELSATSTAGLTGFTYTVLSGPGSITTTTLTFTASGSVAVRAAQAGNSNYLSTAATQSVSVSKSPVTSITITSNTLSQPYNGSPRTITATSDPSGLAMIYLYNGGPSAPVQVGTYSVRATVNDAMYSGTTTDLMTIVKGHATITVLHTNQVYDGTARAVIVATLPIGLSVDITYDGSGIAPVNAGTVTVTAAISPSEPSYTGAVTTLLRIAPADQTIDFPMIGRTLQESRVGLSASASSGLPVTFSVTDPGALSNGTNLSFTGTGVVTVTASQAGNENWNSASTRQDVVVFAAAVYLDFDGDRKADITVYHPTTGFWYILQSSNMTGRALTLGGPDSVPCPGDYDGDAIVDPAVYRPENGEWSILLSATQEQTTQYWGWAEALPVPGDYDGDGITDVAVCDIADGVWYMLLSSTGESRITTWGWGECVPVQGDYDGDLITDIAVYWPEGGQWYILQSATQAERTQAWGWAEAEPMPGDYDGDGKTDVAVYWPERGMWYAWLSATQAGSTHLWGWNAAWPVPADYDGDGKSDRTVYVPSEGQWYLWQSGSNTPRTQSWGFEEAEPVK